MKTFPVLLVAFGGALVAGSIFAVLPLTQWHGMGYWADCVFTAMVGIVLIVSGADLLEQMRRR